jgi:hypothetical protein
MSDQFARACDPTRPTKAGVIGKACSLLRKQFVEGKRGSRVVPRDVFPNFVSIGICHTRPNQLHEFDDGV